MDPDFGTNEKWIHSCFVKQKTFILEQKDAGEQFVGGVSSAGLKLMPVYLRKKKKKKIDGKMSAANNFRFKWRHWQHYYSGRIVFSFYVFSSLFCFYS